MARAHRYEMLPHVHALLALVEPGPLVDGLLVRGSPCPSPCASVASAPVFAGMHLHYSPTFGLAAFLPGVA